jgi:lipopolysaccharide transport system ATP-binding protein
MRNVIEVRNLSKIYRLGEIGTGTISRDFERWLKINILKQEDPFLKIGEVNERDKKGESDIIYSIHNINLEVGQGETLGIIGKNGAGKSTLLKILSRVTGPTTGKLKIKGRVASLLEVGTGFHPELTGRENIYLNGAILGMRKKEITHKLDEIIDFSGVERYIDTPVKRYSSGMYVRLAFSVAAHLESEILLVDEVLAVGDVEFQNKCLGKMGSISKGEGRTILFVSHNMGAILNLCQTGIVLNDGKIKMSGSIIDCVEQYNSNNTSTSNKDFFSNRLLAKNKNAILKNVIASYEIKTRSILIKLEIYCSTDIKIKNIGIGVNTFSYRITTIEMQNEGISYQLEKGLNMVFCEVPIALNPGKYSLLVLLESIIQIEDYIDDKNIILEVPEYYVFKKPTILSNSQGNILINAKWRR